MTEYTYVDRIVDWLTRLVQQFKRIFGKKTKSSMQVWAEKEAALYNEKHSKNTEWGEYDRLCCDSALRAFIALMNDDHSGFSIRVTKQLLNRLIDGRALTPIEDVPENWSEGYDRGDGEISYHCLRMSSLFKHVYPDGTTKYSDVDSSQCVNVDTGGMYTSGLVRRIMNELFPITMPYYPPSRPTMVYCKECLFDVKNGDFDTVGVLYAVKSSDEHIESKKGVEINRFFKEGPDGWEEIQKEEYLARMEFAAITTPIMKD